MRAFIVRPLNARNGIDFNVVQETLIDPALREAGIAADTAMQFVEAGDIRVDMLEQLLLADLVIADISVHDANVFYELGLRHALRARQTILIRAGRIADDDVPFDLRTDRCLEYDHNDPAASLPELQRMLTDTKASERKDSPVFLSLPALAEQDRSRFSPVPAGFVEEAERAAAAKDIPYLGLLATEAAGFTWDVEGWRVVGRLLFEDSSAWPAALRTLERIRAVDPNDVEANLWLATVFQRLDDLTSSDQALTRVLGNPAATRKQQSEAWALRGSNEKLLWVQSWASLPPEQRGEAALRSPFLHAAFESYEKAFSLDPNHFYPGLAALSLLTMRKELSEQFDHAARIELERELASLAGAVRLSLEGNTNDEWYWQLQIFADLGLKADRVAECMALFAEDDPPAPRPAHVVVFTGHRVDRPDRNPPRFPASCVEAARDAIRKRLAELRPTLGIAAAASGGDILFHEACADLGIPTEVLLVMPPQKFVDESVADNGQQWVDAFWTLIDRSKAENLYKQLGDQDELPEWLRRKPQYNIWSRANLWMIEQALSKSPERLTVMALWNGKEGDGPGGTKDLLITAKELGATPAVIDTNEICR